MNRMDLALAEFCDLAEGMSIIETADADPSPVAGGLLAQPIWQPLRGSRLSAGEPGTRVQVKPA